MLEPLFNRVLRFETRNFNHLFLSFVKFFLKGRNRSETSPPTLFSALFFISHVLSTDQMLLPDLKKMHSLHKKRPVFKNTFFVEYLQMVAFELFEY